MTRKLNLKLSVQRTAFVFTFFNRKKHVRDHNFIWLWLPGSSWAQNSAMAIEYASQSCHTPSLVIVLNYVSFGPKFLFQFVLTIILLHVLQKLPQTSYDKQFRIMSK